MRMFVAILIVSTYVFTASIVYAGEAWPWVVGGLAGILTISAIQDSNRRQNREVHHYYHQQQPVYQQQAAYPVGVRAQERTWTPGGYDIDGNYHPGYYTYREVIR